MRRPAEARLGAAPHSDSDQRNRERYRTGFRGDIQGMRAIAVLLVVLYHAGIPVLPGGFVGVDMFFVLSGFLITGIMAAEIERTGRFSIATFYAKRIVRIIPAATVVLVVTAIATLVWIPATRWRSIAEETVGSALYVSNWQFAASTNYLNADVPPSPLQHFWSLAVEEQYYILWPIVIVIVLALLRRRHRSRIADRALRILPVAMAVIVLLSFAFALLAVARWPEPAYFITPTRLWEIGVGSLLAFAVPAIRRIPRRWRRLVGLAGLLMVGIAAVGYSAATPFPGATAVLPTFGMAAMIAGGVSADGESLRSPVLAHPIAQWFGDISYSLYLWHWPLLIVAEAGFRPLRIRTKLALMVLAVLLAWLSTRFVESPIRRIPGLRTAPRRAFLLGAAGILLSVGAAAMIWGSLSAQLGASESAQATAPGARAIPEGGQAPVVQRAPRGLTPNPAVAADDNPAIYSRGCHLEASETQPKECAIGSGSTVLLVGDSHAAQWYPALEALAQQRGFRLVSMTKSSCPLIERPIEQAGKHRTYSECAAWNTAVQKYIAQERPALVVTTALETYTAPGATRVDRAALAAGFADSWRRIRTAGVPVLALADTPYMSQNVPTCVATHPDDVPRCRTPRSEALAAAGVLRDAARAVPGVTFVDLNPRICPGAQCEPIIGDVLVYRDAHHLSATYSRSLAADLASAAGRLVPQSTP